MLLNHFAAAPHTHPTSTFLPTNQPHRNSPTPTPLIGFPLYLIIYLMVFRWKVRWGLVCQGIAECGVHVRVCNLHSGENHL